MTSDMTLSEAIAARHSVRCYTGRPIEPEKIDLLRSMAGEINRESGLNIQVVTNDPKAFSGRLAHYGKFSGVNDYLAMVGPRGDGLDEAVGYHGERLVLEAQRLMLNTCWVGLTYRKNPLTVEIPAGNKLVCVIALGYGVTQGVAHKSKPMEKVVRVDGEMPSWFRAGVEAALLAPTAMNQQKFTFRLTGGNLVSATAGLGFFSRVDLGIVKRHFEIGAGRDNFRW